MFSFLCHQQHHQAEIYLLRAHSLTGTVIQLRLPFAEIFYNNYFCLELLLRTSHIVRIVLFPSSDEEHTKENLRSCAPY
jgi:hypothetical protein